MATITVLPSLDAINARVWKLAEFVHPPSGDHLGWVQRVLARYSVEARTIDGALSYEWAVVLWHSLLDTEQEKSQQTISVIRARKRGQWCRKNALSLTLVRTP